jgi:amino acid transporter
MTGTVRSQRPIWFAAWLSIAAVVLSDVSSSWAAIPFNAITQAVVPFNEIIDQVLKLIPSVVDQQKARKILSTMENMPQDDLLVLSTAAPEDVCNNINCYGIDAPRVKQMIGLALKKVENDEKIRNDRLQLIISFISAVTAIFSFIVSILSLKRSSTAITISNTAITIGKRLREEVATT